MFFGHTLEHFYAHIGTGVKNTSQKDKVIAKVNLH